MTARIVLLVTSPRLPAGLLTSAAWDVVRQHPVLTGAETELVTAVRQAGAEVTVVDGPATQPLLDAVATHGTVVWLAGPAGDEALARELGLRLARQPGLAEMELMYGSWDPPGARLLDAVAVMDRLASPGGDPWKRAQTHRSLAGYLLEESYEAYDAISADDTDALREELGDVLLQVVLHARLAEELPEDERWTIDDVAGGLVDKMIRRNPHVFAGAEAGTLEDITENWERIKRAEKARDSVLDGVALSQPALALAAQILKRAARRGIEVPPPLAATQVDAEARLGASLLATVAAAREAGIDPEAALRRATLAYAEAIRTAESPPAETPTPEPPDPR
ncbi:nucleoside triphosphate pyrophosphohydrolase [Micromonospora zamorensis]|uniref:nucleoside triphosphate pyrophosphohydrolase n=1 Tax=Micromonospora zamorensis TaxID=709883 RepID=UPI00081FB066|nr:nucleoside triphosphate pyrophosphohydrolase [Micromonospora zamorensis]WTE84755.1 nucleoside triphosphate pyrophosphohydrolase [Micromonospora zamorensis]SCG34787.1 XTP/dITP diphosphohydrolase [Micromonospora zamorensis]